MYATVSSSLISCAVIQEGHLPVQTPFKIWHGQRKEYWSLTRVANGGATDGSHQTRLFVSRYKQAGLGGKPWHQVMHVSCWHENGITGAPSTVGDVAGCVLTMSSVGCLPLDVYEYTGFSNFMIELEPMKPPRASEFIFSRGEKKVCSFYKNLWNAVSENIKLHREA